MSLHWGANQYQNAFRPQRLQNHEVPMEHRQMPNTLEGCTRIIGDDRGHLLPGVSRSQDNPWGNFVGTWDLPCKISGNRNTVPTARNTYSQDKMKQESHEHNLVLSGQIKNEKRLTSKDGKPATDSHLVAKPATPQEAPLSPKQIPICEEPPKPATPPKSPCPRKTPSQVGTPTQQPASDPACRPDSATGVW